MLLYKHGLIVGLLSGLMIFPATATMAETPEDAWDIAVNSNHQIKSAKADTSASEQQLYSAKGQRLPELNVGSGYIQYSETPPAIANFEGQTGQFNTKSSRQRESPGYCLDARFHQRPHQSQHQCGEASAGGAAQ